MTDRAQLARAFKNDRIPERFTLPQAVNHPLDPLHGADDHAGKEQHQPQADEEQHQRLPAEELAALGNLLLELLTTGKYNRTGGLNHLRIGVREGFKSGGGGGIRTAVFALELRQIVQILTQRLIEFVIWQHPGVGVQHFAVAFTLVLIDPLQRAIVQHAVLAIATLHLKRGVGHRLATASINKRGAVSQGRLCT